MKIIVYTVDKELGIFNSLGESCREPPYTDFLLRDYGDTIKCFANIDFDVANLLALILDPEEMKQLSKLEKLYIAPYHLTYFPNKFFSIAQGFAKGRPYSPFCDISQYDDRLDKTTNTHSVELCFERVKLAEDIALQVYNALVKIGCEPKSLISPANVFVESKIKTLDLPDINDMPDGAVKLAYKCAKGNWLEAYKRGHYEQVFDYDLSSAYASCAADLYDIRRGKWVQSKEYQPEAVYGYCDAEVSLDTAFSPILYKVLFDNERDELTYTPNDVFEVELAKSKFDLLDKYNIGFGTITDAWWWIPDKTKPQYQPMKGMINWLYDKKQSAEGMDRKIYKRIMAGAFYGIFLQRKGSGLGEHFLPCWGAEIESACQCKVFQTIMDNKLVKSLLHIAVDGFISERQMETPSPDKIGEWRLSYQGKALVCGSGLVAVEGKIGEGDFSVSYDWLYNQIKNDPQSTSYKMTKNTILTLGKAINENRLNELGNVITVERVVDCLSENKRDYARAPNCGGDLLTKHYNSVPWSIGMINLMTGQNKEEEDDA